MNLEGSRSRARVYDTLLVLVSAGVAYGTFAAFRVGWEWLGFALVAGLGCIAYGVFIEPRLFVVRRYRESIIPEPKTWVRVVFLSDLHAGGFRSVRWYERLALEAQALDPDILVLGGDFVVDRAAPIQDLSAFAAVRAHLGRYFVIGNHDFFEHPARIRRTLSGWGYTDLTNAHVSLTKEGRALQLSALDDPWHGRPEVPLQRGADYFPHVTIAHEPDALLDLAEGDTDLVLSGHTHGGQIRLPFIGSMWKLPCKIGRQGDRGRRIVNGTRLIVSAGVSESDMRARFLCRPEIVVVEIGI